MPEPIPPIPVKAAARAACLFTVLRGAGHLAALTFVIGTAWKYLGPHKAEPDPERKHLVQLTTDDLTVVMLPDMAALLNNQQFPMNASTLHPLRPGSSLWGADPPPLSLTS